MSTTTKTHPGNCSVCGYHLTAIIHTKGDYYDHPFQLALPADSSPEQPAPEGDGRLICKSHGLAVLMTHVNDGEPCSDYLSDRPKDGGGG